jgi:hypothetical protein
MMSLKQQARRCTRAAVDKLNRQPLFAGCRQETSVVHRYAREETCGHLLQISFLLLSTIWNLVFIAATAFSFSLDKTARRSAVVRDRLIAELSDLTCGDDAASGRIARAIRNISEKGACLKVQTTVGIPEEFVF